MSHSRRKSALPQLAFRLDRSTGWKPYTQTRADAAQFFIPGLCGERAIIGPVHVGWCVGTQCRGCQDHC